MPLFRPRLIELPNGTRLSYRAFRARERLDTRKKAAAVRTAEVAADLDATRRRDDYLADTAQRARDTKAGRRATFWRSVRRALAGLTATLATNRPLIAAVTMAGLCVTATVSGQIMVYTSINWHGWNWLAYVLPGIVEGASWTSAINASWLASRPTPLAYHNHIRLMWCYATYAALSNGWHFAHTLHDPVTGVLLGAASIVGPATWHRYITLTTTHHSGRTSEDVVRALVRRVCHPFLLLRAVSLWSAADGTLTRSTAWRLTWERVHGAPPGFVPVARAAPARNQRLFRWVFGTMTIPSTPSTATIPSTTAATTAPSRNPPPPAAIATATAPTDWAEQVDRFLTNRSDAPQRRLHDDAPNPGTTTRPPPQRPSSPLVAHPTATSTTTAATPTATATRRPTATRPQPDPIAAQKVRTYYRAQRDQGFPPREIRPVDAARIAGCSPQFASRELKKLREQESLHP